MFDSVLNPNYNDFPQSYSFRILLGVLPDHTTFKIYIQYLNYCSMTLIVFERLQLKQNEDAPESAHLILLMFIWIIH